LPGTRKRSSNRFQPLQEGQMIPIRPLIAGLVIAAAASAAAAQDRVVYHVDDAVAQGLKALRSIRNHLDVDPAARITVVTLADGVDMLLEDAQGPGKVAYAPLISALRARGVGFEIREITLASRNLKKEQFIQEADFTPSGVVRIARLQKEGAAYIKP
jgi:intracellular sulfur oxidation DsrE/DsrF family protein